jgi:hypothetical protein
MGVGVSSYATASHGDKRLVACRRFVFSNRGLPTWTAGRRPAMGISLTAG